MHFPLHIYLHVGHVGCYDYNIHHLILILHELDELINDLNERA